MVRSRGTEFPQLQGLGLQACDIKGDGNCLFRALSDQLFGSQEHHAKIRAQVVDCMRQNPDQYKCFVVVVGAERRAPKRKTTAASFSSSISSTSPTEDQINQKWEEHLEKMARKNTWGTNMEAVAFTKAFDMDLKIFKENGTIWYIQADEDNSTVRPCLYIAFHEYDHYSSVRNINGPFTGVPNVQMRDISPAEEAELKATLPKISGVIEPWMIQRIKTLVPNYIDERKIKRTLEECKGNVDAAYNILYDEVMSASSGRSSVERDSDSDDDDIVGPNKRQNRRIKGAKALRKLAPIALVETDSSPSETDSATELPQKSATILSVETDPSPPGRDSAAQFSQKQPPTLQTTRNPKKSLSNSRKQQLRKTKARSDSSDNHDDWAAPSDDDGSEYSTISRSQSLDTDSIPPPFPKITIRINKASQKQYGPQQKHTRARDLKQQKKLLQKQVRKESKRNSIKDQVVLSSTNLNVKSETIKGSNKLDSSIIAKGGNSPSEVVGFHGLTINI